MELTFEWISINQVFFTSLYFINVSLIKLVVVKKALALLLNQLVGLGISDFLYCAGIVDVCGWRSLSHPGCLCLQMADCVSKVELTVSCSNLLDKDVGSKSDPLCVLLQSSGDDKWTEVPALRSVIIFFKAIEIILLSVCQLGRTEHLKNTPNPTFSQRLRLDYQFETVQNLKLGIYDIDNSTSDLADDDYLGGLEVTLGQVRQACETCC